MLCRIFGHKWIYHAVLTEEGWWTGSSRGLANSVYYGRTCGRCQQRELFQNVIDRVAYGKVSFPTICPYPSGSPEDVAWTVKEKERRQKLAEIGLFHFDA
jgi:hypothetical protein